MMDLKAVHDALGDLLLIDSNTRAIGQASTSVQLQLDRDEALQILRQRRAACEDRLRKLGFVAAHDSTAQTLREFRDRADRKGMPPPKPTGEAIPMDVGTSPQDMRSASSLGFSG